MSADGIRKGLPDRPVGLFGVRAPCTSVMGSQVFNPRKPKGPAISGVAGFAGARATWARSDGPGFSCVLRARARTGVVGSFTPAPARAVATTSRRSRPAMPDAHLERRRRCEGGARARARGRAGDRQRRVLTRRRRPRAARGWSCTGIGRSRRQLLGIDRGRVDSRPSSNRSTNEKVTPKQLRRLIGCAMLTVW